MRIGATRSIFAIGLALLVTACAGHEEPKRKKVEVSRYLIQVEEQQANSIASLQAAAARGDAQAKHALGVAYAEGVGVAADPSAAISLWREAAAQNDPDAQNALALAHAQGYGVRPDMNEALRLWRLAAEQGQTLAQYNLGNALVVHAQSRAEVLEGIEWLRRAADNGDAGAQFFLANLYYTGQGVARDPDEARRLWQTAAAQGHPTAAIALVEPARVTAEPPADMPFPVALREDAPLPPPSLRDGPPVRPSDIGRAEAAPVVAAVAPVVTPVPRHVEVPQDAPRRAVPEYRPSPGKGGKATVKGGKGKKSATAVAARGQGGKRAVASPGAGGRKPAVAASKARAAPAAKAAVPTAKPAAAKARAAKPAATKPAKARAR